MNKATILLKDIVHQIDTRPIEDLTVHTIAECVGLSRWQVQRTFLALTGLSLSEHLRQFKLSIGAKQLVNTQQGILDIALDTGFGSQEAFARAFKSHFGLTPGQYRKRGLLDDVSFQLFIPQDKQWSKAMNIKIETKPAMNLVGLCDYFNGHGMENANNFEILPALWARFNAETQAQAQNIGTFYGLIYESDDPARGQLRYLASYNENDGDIKLSAPVREPVAGQQFAVLPHHGLLQNIGETLDAFYGQWLPESDYRMDGNVNIEVYDERFNPMSEESYFETWVPVVLKTQ
ncbi:MAG: AraC family transcriptional regulator [Reinekea sp.]|nr:AraC family transcriptional regulator [Reinekea sp.]